MQKDSGKVEWNGATIVFAAIVFLGFVSILQGVVNKYILFYRVHAGRLEVLWANFLPMWRLDISKFEKIEIVGPKFISPIGPPEYKFGSFLIRARWVYVTVRGETTPRYGFCPYSPEDLVNQIEDAKRKMRIRTN